MFQVMGDFKQDQVIGCMVNGVVNIIEIVEFDQINIGYCFWVLFVLDV